MKTCAPSFLLACANGNMRARAGLVRQSPFSPEFFALSKRVLDGRDAYRRAGLSERGTRVLQALGYLAPTDLQSPTWTRSPGEPGLLDRAAGVRGCGPMTMRALRLWLSEAW
jgi:hypothetical protein